MKFLWSPLWALLTTILLFGISQSNPKFLQMVELKWFDIMMLDEPVKSEETVLINIGEKALINHGQFPFPRDVYADLIHRLRLADAGVIVFNMSFPEKDRSGQDAEFISAMSQGVVLSHFPDWRPRRSVYTTGIAEIGERAGQFVPQYRGIIGNLPEYEKSASGIGLANTLPEIDGVVRRLPLVSESNEILYPSILLEIMKVYSGTNTYSIKSNVAGIQAIKVRKFKKILTSPDGQIWINPNITHETYEMDDVFTGLAGKTVFVGVTANGLANPVPTANGGRYAHEVAASAYSSLRMGYDINQPYYSDFVRDYSVLVIGLLIVLLSWFRFGGLAVLLIPISVVYATQADFLYSPINGALFGLLVALHVYGVKYVQEFMAKMQIKKQFGTYLSPDMVMMLQKDPTLLKLGGERKEMTFLFMDIVGFTPISEYYKNNDDPEGLVLLVNEFLDAMTQIILNNGGTIDKYMGDCIMAFWNAPLPCANHAEMAVKSAIEIESKTNELKAVYKERGLPDINVGTGVNTGNCIVGNMGSDSRFDYSVIGDAVNLAARLEATAARHEYLEYKTIISSMTKDQLPEDFPTTKIGEITVKGKEDVITIYSPY